MSTAESQFEQFRADRIAEVTAPRGALALVLTQWDQPGEPIPDEATALAGFPATAELTRLSRPHIDSGDMQHGYRVWQQDSPAAQAFEGIGSYDYDPNWVITGRFEFVDADRVVPFEHIRDGGALRRHAVSGDLVFTHEGTEYRVEALDTTLPSGPGLQLVFADKTNGAESYGAGRFLYVQLPDLGRALKTGDVLPVTLDFNTAEIPPCGFSNQMNCPLPPLRNRLPFPVRAGETKVQYAEGFSL
ncbi:DUF1684 domain-containing protein [Microbacterium sp. YY-03]|uniref:DUF1684 domain-containing protein n=1 Tax=Microbacterium sp. YY-03 TaxID=3421636 RepID=UPI003D176773